ncbi:hypothetical protein [Chroococcidiopsis sp. CCMEE 29]|uniref:hypothetical protein n=1 Tax=Chroococcidiopsis sp. CCMEE 29 TaxID=155894 RepID=UPI002020ED96|nr:hypothetical protein [Chroococcidiopsis sp. CCMEE 29]
MRAIYRALIGASIGTAIAAVGGGIGAVATSTWQFGIVRDMTIVTGEKHSNWQRNELIKDAKERCLVIEDVGIVLTAMAVDHNLKNAPFEEKGRGYGTVFVATKYACPQYSVLFAKAYESNAYAMADGAERIGKVYQVLGQDIP